MRLYRPTGSYGDGDAPCAPVPCSATQCSCYEDASVPWLWLNLAIAGALCASYALGSDPPLDCRPVAGMPDAVTIAMWHPGCGRPSQ